MPPNHARGNFGRPMKFAVIGTGVIGRLRAQTVAEHPDCTLVAVCDVNRAGAEQTGQAYAAAAYDDHRRMLDRGGIDAVMVAGPGHLHHGMCIDVFEAGCHVLVEKPLAPRPDECEEILAAQKKAKRVLGVGFNFRFYPAMQYAKHVIREGRVGTIDHIRVYGGHDGLNNFRQEWMYKAEMSGGGAMMDVGLHMTDTARFIGGEITSVYARASNRVWHVDGSEDNATCIFDTEGGAPIIYQASWNAWKGFEMSVEAYGDLGMVRGQYAPMQNLLITHDKPGAPRKTVTKRYPEIILREKVQGWETTTLDSFRGELADFLRMARGEKSIDLADGWDGLRATQIAHAVYESSRTKKPVDLPRRTV